MVKEVKIYRKIPVIKIEEIKAYMCEKCGRVYDNLEKAMICERRPASEFKFRVGETVITNSLSYYGCIGTVRERKRRIKKDKHVNIYVIDLPSRRGLTVEESSLEKYISLAGLFEETY